MGLAASMLGGGFPSTQMLGLVQGKLYNKFIQQNITTFDEFHVAILDIFNSFNSALPGKHYDGPSREKVEECFKKWKDEETPDKRKIFTDFMKDSVTPSRLDDATLITGLVTPPAAMAAKKAGESVPQLNVIKAVPDVIFIPAATVLALISVKLSRKTFFNKQQNQDQTETAF